MTDPTDPTGPTGPTDPTDPIDPAAPPMTRDDPAYVRWLKVLLVGLGGTVPLEAEEAEPTQEEGPLIHYPCASCGATRDVRKLGAPPSASGAGADV
ncbi:hypothetical protein [Streptomyces corynorhini]|uniref:hypothetical protein n=1 Tax=Streptomyces corynorhini TaxID=2282652 RepID=UPI0013148EBE|nr:hypothetical protein [Streptomyces corynorhini]